MTAPNTFIEKQCSSVRTSLTDILAWKWDDRFGLARAEFKVKDADIVKDTILKELQTVWDHTTIAKASGNIRKIVNSMGGIGKGQILFSAEPENSVTLFCAWWPWGDEETVSVRIGFRHEDDSMNTPAFVSGVRKFFGI